MVKFDEMVEVHRHLESNGQFGKIVVTVSVRTNKSNKENPKK